MSATLPKTLESRTFPAGDYYTGGQLRFKATGEFRNPLRGEWYLSGATIEAWRAPSDLSTPYWIAVAVAGGCAMKRVNPDHNWLTQRGWCRAGENRMGNRVQYLWSHPRHAGRTYSTNAALEAQARDDKHANTQGEMK